MSYYSGLFHVHSNDTSDAQPIHVDNAPSVWLHGNVYHYIPENKLDTYCLIAIYNSPYFKNYSNKYIISRLRKWGP